MATPMRGTATFSDCACTACAGARTLDASLAAVSRAADSLIESHPTTIAPADMARMNDPRRHDNSLFEPFMRLPQGASYYIAEIDHVATVMHRRDAKAEGGTGAKTGDALREAWRAETAQNEAFAQRQRDYHARRAANPAASVRAPR